MRRFYVALALLILVIIVGFSTGNYLNGLEKELTVLINAAEDNFSDDLKTATADILRAQKLWESNIPYLSIFINSETLDEISLSFLDVIAATDAEKSDFNASIYSLKFKLTDLIKTEKLSLMSFI